MGRIAKNVLFTLVVWAALLLAAEGALRLYQRFAPRPAEWADTQLLMCEPHPTRIWHYKAGYHQAYRSPEFQIDVRTNSSRLREPEIEPGEGGVLAVGDSFTFGWGVEEGERFTERLEEGLGGREGKLTRIVNAGHWMYTFDQQLLLVRELVPRLRPRVVVQGIYSAHLLTLMSHRWERDSGGDLRSVHNDGIRVTEDGALRFTNTHLESPPFRSRLAAAVFRIWFNWRLSKEGATADLALLDPGSMRYEIAWRMFEDCVAETARYLRGAGVEYVAFGIPRDLQVSPDEWTAAYRASVEGRALDLDLPSRRVAAVVIRSGATWVDLLPAFRRSYRPDLYFAHDPHWTREGHGLAARVLAPAIGPLLGLPPGEGPGQPPAR
jgi:hypothetical protein